MKIKYAEDYSYELMTCSCCNYSVKKYRGTVGYGNEPMIEGTAEFLYEEQVDYAPNRLVKKTVYACPKCGCLQIDV